MWCGVALLRGMRDFCRNGVLGCVRDLGVRGIFWRAARLADTGASRSKQAAQLSPGAALPALCLWSRGPGICPWKCRVSWMGEGIWWGVCAWNCCVAVLL